MDTFYKGVIAVAGEIAGFLFWRLERAAYYLSVLVIDYASGLMAAGINGEK